MCHNINKCNKQNPFLCPDFTCKSNNNSCPIDNDCPYYKCNDNLCVTDESLCIPNTYCPVNLPIKCSDNTCRSSVEDCPIIMPCDEDKPFRCSNGLCSTDNFHCKTNIEIYNKSLVYCGDGNAYETINDCFESNIEFKCDHRLCPDGTCRSEDGRCDSNRCPINRPMLCENGECVNDISNCLRIENCTNNLVKCFDGTCMPSII